MIASAKQLGENRDEKRSPSAITFISVNVNKDLLPGQSGKDVPCTQNLSKNDINRSAMKSNTYNGDMAHE